MTAIERFLPLLADAKHLFIVHLRWRQGFTSSCCLATAFETKQPIRLSNSKVQSLQNLTLASVTLAFLKEQVVTAHRKVLQLPISYLKDVSAELLKAR